MKKRRTKKQVQQLERQILEVLALDNLSGLDHRLPDALCRLAAGGALSGRKLYTDSDETLIEVQRPVILNGIDDLATRPDLAERQPDD